MMRPVSRICGVILSAGESSRMGSPKALLALADGTPLIRRQAEILSEAGCAETACVVGADAELILGFDERMEVQWLINEDWEKGQFTSVQTGLAWMLDRGGDGAIVLPVDCVVDSPSTVGSILEAAIMNPHLDALIPEYGERGGHPVYISRGAAERIVSMDPDRDDARLDVQIGMMERTMRLPVNDQGILRNVNTPEDWERMRSSLPTSRRQ